MSQREIWQFRDVVRKYEGNPILTKKDCPWPVQYVYNAGATKYKGKYILMPRCLGMDGICTLGLAESDDGYHFKMRPRPAVVKATEGPFAMYETKGVEDARITQFGDTYYIFYSAFAGIGMRIGLMQTNDFERFDRIALTTTTDYRNSVLFPEKIGGRYVRFERPNIAPWGTWISYSPDLIYWGDQRLVATPCGGTVWDDAKIGPGSQPVKTKEGWLMINHAATWTMMGFIYRLGVQLHDLEDPSIVRGYSRQFIIAPDRQHEQIGYVPNVVFCCGAIAEPDGTLKIYYGGADTNMNVAEANISDLVDLCLNYSRPPI